MERVDVLWGVLEEFSYSNKNMVFEKDVLP